MEQGAIDFKKFPTTRYQGSKRKILPWIFENVKNLEFDSVLDACGGSASVSYLFKKMNKQVTYNDKLKFNYLIGKALIENQNIKFLQEDINNLLSCNATGHDFIQTTFKNIYYLNHENKWLDAVSYGVFNMNHYQGNVLDYKKAVAYYALFQSCLIKRPFNLFHRKNLEIRTNDVKRNFGNKTTWEKPFENYFNHFISEANEIIFDSKVPCKSINESILNISDTNFDLIYLDPPYLTNECKNETANYFKCYHFLEGLVNYPEWGELIDFDSINLRLKNVDIENDFKRHTIYNTLDQILEKFSKSKIVFSYKKAGKPSIEWLVKTIKKHKKKVYTRSLHYQYALNRQNGDANQNREVLIIGI